MEAYAQDIVFNSRVGPNFCFGVSMFSMLLYFNIYIIIFFIHSLNTSFIHFEAKWRCVPVDVQNIFFFFKLLACFLFRL